MVAKGHDFPSEWRSAALRRPCWCWRARWPARRWLSEEAFFQAVRSKAAARPARAAGPPGARRTAPRPRPEPGPHGPHGMKPPWEKAFSYKVIEAKSLGAQAGHLNWGERRGEDSCGRLGRRRSRCRPQCPAVQGELIVRASTPFLRISPETESPTPTRPAPAPAPGPAKPAEPKAAPSEREQSRAQSPFPATCPLCAGGSAARPALRGLRAGPDGAAEPGASTPNSPCTLLWLMLPCL